MSDEAKLLSAAEREAMSTSDKLGDPTWAFHDRRKLLAHLDAITAPADGEALGRKVRDEWIAWAKEQPNPKPSWLVPWEGLSEPDRDVDRRIGLRCHAIGYAAGVAKGEEERARLAEDLEGERRAYAVRAETERTEIARLTAELAAGAVEIDKVRGHLGLDMFATLDDCAIEGARLVAENQRLTAERDTAKRDGARVEREAIVEQVRHWAANGRDGMPVVDGDTSLVDWIATEIAESADERGEGSAG